MTNHAMGIFLFIVGEICILLAVLFLTACTHAPHAPGGMHAQVNPGALVCAKDKRCGK